MHKHTCSAILFISGIALILSGCIISLQQVHDYKPPSFVICGFVLFFSSLFIFHKENNAHVSDTKHFSDLNIGNSNIVITRIHNELNTNTQEENHEVV